MLIVITEPRVLPLQRIVGWKFSIGSFNCREKKEIMFYNSTCNKGNLTFTQYVFFHTLVLKVSLISLYRYEEESFQHLPYDHM